VACTHYRVNLTHWCVEATFLLLTFPHCYLRLFVAALALLTFIAVVSSSCAKAWSSSAGDCQPAPLHGGTFRSASAPTRLACVLPTPLHLTLGWRPIHRGLLLLVFSVCFFCWIITFLLIVLACGRDACSWSVIFFDSRPCSIFCSVFTSSTSFRLLFYV
jgi:hypothetical protein